MASSTWPVPKSQTNLETIDLNTQISSTTYQLLLDAPYGVLTCDNAPSWHWRFYLTMRSANMLGFLLGRVPCPELQSPFSDAEEREADLQMREEQVMEWGRRDGLIQTLIMNNISNPILEQMPDSLNTSADMWKYLIALHKESNNCNYLQLISKLTKTRYVDGEDFRDHIAKMQSFRNQMICFEDRDIPGELFACFLRLSMPKSWDVAFADLPDPLTSEEVIRRINAYSAMRRLRRGAETQAGPTPNAHDSDVGPTKRYQRSRRLR